MDKALSSWKIPLYLLLFGVLTIIGVFWEDFGQQKYTAGQVAGTNTNLEVFVQPETGRKPILEAINNAQTEVLVEVYLLSDREVVDALVGAAERGVGVQVMMEQHPFGGGNVNRLTADRLRSTAVEFKWTNPTFALTHEKAIIVDGQTLFILNQNLTQSAFSKNREYNIIDYNPEDVSEARQMFLADWERKRYGPKAPNLIVSPENARGKLEALINSAQQSLDVEAEIIQDRDMIKSLGVKARGIGVRVILPDFGKVAANREEAEELKQAGVEVRTLRSPYVHAKLILVDQVRAYVGSVNLSDASLDQNRELGILVSQADIMEKLSRTFENDWQKAQEI
ncbi:MAG: hypothetical protein UY21_C0012G0007 [Microgenomates group bacterium GW2011_GWA1_48_10]|uniref:phospholipase D n=1 Tax=Candidatus Gottesmanbacteria bacterium RIFCSPHIGHO2_01_FULL_47_48 TaxID=1798381 RepID=A0A1F6A4Q2_9BACT|nr:MAG: hypothetical protein UY21_C0012G0007 [Microgenomates group bacterium GW2011_GWA1_48_10]OGG19661.1 MAG: hypothetical protein A2721_00915 [Candidatus Gottesmanbacteria bacterium RIFCSPHIGHO2_01_FULL_47_48]